MAYNELFILVYMFDYYGSFLLDPFLILSPLSSSVPHYFSQINNSSKFCLGLISLFMSVLSSVSYLENSG